MDPKWTDGNELEYLRQVLENSSEIRQNPFTDRLEKAFLKKYGVKYAIALTREHQAYIQLLSHVV